MSSDCRIVVKLGGDALASPERIAVEARRLAALSEDHEVIAVASARRGVTDHLLGLVAGVRRAVGGSTPSHAEADRAVATGEVVTAALLALALNELGVEAVSLDAREAGVRATGRFGGARIRGIAPKRIKELLARRIVPVVTGFQGWHRGRVATLGRGGTDTSAIALAVAVGAGRVIFVKDSDGLRTADPKLVPDSIPLPVATHGFLSALTAAGAKVVNADAARLAEAHRLPLEFFSLADAAPVTVVHPDAAATGLRAIATQLPGRDEAYVTAVAADPADAVGMVDALHEALVTAGVPVREIRPAGNGPRFVVAASDAPLATRVLHAAFVRRESARAASARRAS
jgi:aspartate kinase